MLNLNANSLVTWVKTHKMVLVLGVAVVYLALKSTPVMMGQRAANFATYESASPMMGSAVPLMSDAGYKVNSFPSFVPPMQPRSGSVDISAPNRKVVRNSDVSLLVKDVRASLDQITQYAVQAGGFMVNSSVLTPDQGGSGNLSIRIPSEKLDATLQYLRGLSVRVVSENVTGSDVTDQFTDTEARLATLTKTKATFEGILNQANDVDEILRVQQSILSVQDQIDALKGQLQYLQKTSESSLITIYLSTDELALPYSPTEPWRPEVIFKTAVRSLMSNMRLLGTAGIWFVVYSPVLIVAVVLIFLLKRKMK